jgi:hypothetical protein
MPRDNYKVNITVNLEVDMKDVSLSTANEKKERLTRRLSSCIGESSDFDSAKKRINVSMRTAEKE